MAPHLVSVGFLAFSIVVPTIYSHRSTQLARRIGKIALAFLTSNLYVLIEIPL
jgi:hypothetical protein